MKVAHKQIAIIISIAALTSVNLSHASCTGNAFSGLVSKAKLILIGIPSEFEFFVKHLDDANTSGIPVTRRGVLHYLSNFHLFTYDFRGKKILDVAAGNSPFASLVNQVYQSQGTRVVALDLSKRALKNGGVRANATEMPFRNYEFDLIISKWFLNNLIPNYVNGIKRYGRHPKKASRIVIGSLKEMIRVTKPGGEIRLYYALGQNTRLIKRVLEKHKSVESYSFTLPLPLRGMIRIRIRQ